MDAREREEFTRAWGSILQKAWGDEDYKARLQENPVPVLRDGGVDVPDDAEVEIQTPPQDAEPNLDEQIRLFEEGRSTGRYLLYVPELGQLQATEISDDQLEGVSAGACCSSILSCCCC
jgi:hypothetical protein